MPPATRRTTTAAVRPGPGHTGKRRRTSTTAANTVSTRPPSRQKKTPAPSKDMEIEELFGPSPTRTLVDLEAKEEEIDTVDLTETNELPEDLKTPEKDNRIKLAAFQCVICMDDCDIFIARHAYISPFMSTPPKGSVPCAVKNLTRGLGDHTTAKPKDIGPSN
ncbi:hypothetical protein ACHAPU_003828 [Fusarium lateritium]